MYRQQIECYDRWAGQESFIINASNYFGAGERMECGHFSVIRRSPMYFQMDLNLPILRQDIFVPKVCMLDYTI